MSERITKVCGNKDCCISTGFADYELTFGRGHLDDYGYWAVPCAACASAWKKAHPLDRVWPARDGDKP